MKHSILVAASAAIFLWAGSAVGAQADGGIYDGWLKPGPPPLERFVKPLALTAEQQQKLRPVFAAAQAAAAADEATKSKAKSPNPDTEGAALLTRETDFRVRLSAVLTAEQMGQYERLTAARAANARTLEAHPAHGHSEMSQPGPPNEPKGAPRPTPP